MLTVAGLRVDEIAEQVGTPVYVVDEDDLRARARDFADRLRGLGRLLRGEVVPLHGRRPLGGRGGPRGRRVHRRRAGRGPAGRASTRAASVCTATTRATPSSSRPWRPASVGSSSTPSTRSTGSAAGRRPRTRGVRPRVMVRVTTGVEAHTHEYIATAHEDQKFGFSIAAGQALDALRACTPPRARSGRHPLPHRLADLRRRGLRGRGPPDAAAARRVRCGDRCRAARAGPRRRVRHRLHQRRHPGDTGRSGRGHRRDHRDRVRGPRRGRPAPVDRARSGDQRSERVRALHRWAPSSRSTSTATRSGSTWPWTAG